MTPRQPIGVFMYDRRGRGDSGDTQPYAKQVLTPAVVEFFTH